MIHASESEIAARILIAAMQCGCVVPSNIDTVCEYYDKVLTRVMKTDKDTSQREQASFADIELP